jgi:uncharacterized protein (TIGR02147 family)
MLANEVSSYRAQLQSELNRRRLANPLYSLRAFSRTLGLSPAHLSKVLRGEKSLSLDSAVKVAERLQYSENESVQFCQMVQESHIRSPRLKRALKLESPGEEGEAPSSLSLEAFQVISDWYHLALREFTECRDFRPDPAHISNRLGISCDEARLALIRLEKLGLLEKKAGSYRKTAASVATAKSDRPREALRQFHSQMIEKAKRSIEARQSEEREISGVTLPISREKIEIAREEIARFQKRMLALMDSSRPTEVYQLNVQFFPLTEKNGSEK